MTRSGDIRRDLASRMRCPFAGRSHRLPIGRSCHSAPVHARGDGRRRRGQPLGRVHRQGVGARCGRSANPRAHGCGGPCRNAHRRAVWRHRRGRPWARDMVPLQRRHSGGTLRHRTCPARPGTRPEWPCHRRGHRGARRRRPRPLLTSRGDVRNGLPHQPAEDWATRHDRRRWRLHARRPPQSKCAPPCRGRGLRVRRARDCPSGEHGPSRDSA